MTVFAYVIYAVLYSLFLYFAVVGVRYKVRQFKYRQIKKKAVKDDAAK